jgi:hypothetical protein
LADEVIAAPLTVPSEGVTVTVTLSPRTNQLTPERVEPVAATVLPFTFHREV